MLNSPSSVNDNAINRLPQIECNVPAEVYKGVLPMAEITDRDVSMHVEKGGYPTRLQSTYTNGKEILKSVTTTEVSLSSIAGKILAKILFLECAS